MAVPAKYREIGDFHEYYSGSRKAPYLTLFVGGNHEASNYLRELHYGGWAAPNIYYLGAANVVRIGQLRIAGLSGIWKGYNYKKPHHESLPYNQDDIRSIYHVRELDTRKLLQIRTQVDIGISHDWPRGVEWQGDYRQLFRKKSFFEEDAKSGTLGSVAAKLVMDRLRPPYWFSAHLHVKFAAIVDHAKRDSRIRSATAETGNPLVNGKMHANSNADEIDIDTDVDDDRPNQAMPSNAEEIDLDMDEADELNGHTSSKENGGKADNVSPEESPSEIVPADVRAQLPASFTRAPPPQAIEEPPTDIHNLTTHFLALDKCLPHRHFLQLLEISGPSINSAESPRLSYDAEWLAITRAFAPLEADQSTQPPRDAGQSLYLSDIFEAREWVNKHIVQADKLAVPQNFCPTAPVYNPTQPFHSSDMPREYPNPQTAAFCELLGIANAFAASEEEIDARMRKGPRPEERRDVDDGRGSGGRGGATRGGRGRGRGQTRGGGSGRGRRVGGRRGGW